MPASIERHTRVPLAVHYTEAGADYRAWSPEFNMHFGYYRYGINPFRRETMLAEMNRVVGAALGLAQEESSSVVDLGCGVGTPTREIATLFPKARLVGVTVVPWQIAMARRLTRAPLSERVSFALSDFTATGFHDGCFDGGYALESSCHDEGTAKEGFIREASRLLKPGSRLVVADGFLKRRTIPGLLRGVFDRVHRNWALEQFANRSDFLEALERHGFRIVGCQELFWRIAPSAAHVPWVSARFMLKELLCARRPLTAARRGHVLASLLAPLVGLARSTFGYYLITAERLPLT